MSGTIGALAELRREIDEIDQSLHELLVRRAAVSEEIAATKALHATPGEIAQIFYPAREADILRQLVARHTGRLPVPTLLQIWREIISASVRLQRPMAVGMVDPFDSGLLAVARSHFGAVMSTRSFDGAATLFEAVTDDPDLIGVLPVPGARDSTTESWWHHLASGVDGAPRVVARLPILKGANEALVIGSFNPGESAADVSLFVIEAATGVMEGDAIAGASILATDSIGAAEGRTIALVAVEGYFETAAAVAELMATLDDETAVATYVGGYAVPITD